MKTRKSLKRFIFLLVVVMFVGCATAPEKSKMIPWVDYSTFASSGHSLKIAEVKGGEETKRDISIPEIDSKEFKEALIETLRKSGLFKEIFTDQSGDYELYTEIVSQKVIPGLTAYAALLVHYRITESKTNQSIWEENIFSQNDAFGANRGKDAIEGAARDNLAQLTRKLSQIFTQHNNK